MKRFMDKLNKIPKEKAGNDLWDRRIELDTFCLLVESNSFELRYYNDYNVVKCCTFCKTSKEVNSRLVDCIKMCDILPELL